MENARSSNSLRWTTELSSQRGLANQTYTSEVLWQRLKEITMNEIKETLQRNCIRCKNWITKHTFETIRKKTKAKVKSTDEYKRLQNEGRKMLGWGKQEELESLCSELEEKPNKSNSRAVFQTVKNVTKPFKLRSVTTKDNAGKKTRRTGIESRMEGILWGTIQWKAKKRTRSRQRTATSERRNQARHANSSSEKVRRSRQHSNRIVRIRWRGDIEQATWEIYWDLAEWVIARRMDAFSVHTNSKERWLTSVRQLLTGPVH